MTTFKSDAQGFLVGELVQGSRDMLATQKRSATVQSQIRSDVRSISRTLGLAAAIARRDSNRNAGTRRPVSCETESAVEAERATRATGRVAPSHDARGRFVAVKEIVSPAGRAGRPAAAVGEIVRTPLPATLPHIGARDAKGRFVGGKRPHGPSDKESPGDHAGGGSWHVPEGRASPLASAVAVSADNIDPTINAVKEVADVVRPVGRGMAVLFGRSEKAKKERRYSRFWTALKNLGGDKKASKAAGASAGGWFGFGRRGGGEGEGGDGLFSNMLGSAAGSLLGRGAGLIGGALGGLGGALKGGGKGLLGLLGKGGGLLKRIPVLGALISGGLALGSAFDMNDDPTKSDEENRAARYHDTGGAVGMGIGGVAGAALGSLLGPAGTIAGGYFGAMLGEKVGQAVGDWSKQLVDADIPGKMLAAWASVTASMGAAWDSFTKKAGELWAGAKDLGGKVVDKAKEKASAVVDTVKAGANAANDVVKGATGVDVKAAAGNAVDATKAAVPVVVDTAKTVGAAMVPDTVKRAAGLVGKAGANAGLLLDAGRGAGMGAMELANFMGQNAHESAGFTRLSESLSYKPERLLAMFKGRNGINTMDDAKRIVAGGQESIGNAIYGGDWGAKKLGNTEEGDGYKFRGRGFVQLTGRANYAAAGKALGLDLEKNPDLAADPAVAAKISAWYWKNYVSAKGAGEDVAQATARINGSAVGLADRQAKVAEWQDRLAGAPGPGAGVAAVPASSLQNVAMANVPSTVPDRLPKPPELDVALTSLTIAAAEKQQISVQLPDTIGQNVGDRALAHIFTGGMGAVS